MPRALQHLTGALVHGALQHVHWVLAVIDLRQRQVRYYDSLGGVDESCMVRCRSFACWRRRCML